MSDMQKVLAASSAINQSSEAALRQLSIILNRHQDICDALWNADLDDSQKWERISEANDAIGAALKELGAPW